MDKKPIRPAGVLQSPYLPSAMQFGRLIFVSGQAALDEHGKVIGGGSCELQTEATMRHIKKILEAAGTGMENVLKITCFLTDAKDYPTYNRMRGKWFPHNPPASTTVVVKELVLPGLLLEVEAVAFVPNKKTRGVK